MRRSLWNRTLSALFAVWIALALGDAAFTHPHCPMHDGPQPSATPGSGAHMGGHGSHSDRGAPEPGGHHLCTCIGACSASTGAIALVAPAELPTVVIAFVGGAAPARGEISPPAARAPFTLPFANGPPRRIA